MAYFREDIGVNLHHWHWHLVYPGFGPEKIVKKDRRGELFYYMHSQLLARYNVERFTNGLPKFKILDLYETIEEGYFPKIIRSTNNRSYPSRPVGLVLKDVHRGGAAVLVDELKIYIARIKEVIKTGSYRDVSH